MTIDEFAQAELRVGKVLAAERVEGSEKLLKLEVDFGSKNPPSPDGSGETRRTILSGIAKWYAPEAMAGRTVVAIVNLDPRVFKIGQAEYTSHGMLLAATNEAGEAVLLTSERDVEPGSQIH